ncbi:MAG: hypothetical protein U1E76_15395 [Planctomycetota bacterium]
MRNCVKVRRDLLRLVEQELAGSALHAALDHVRACAGCAAELAALERSRSAVHSLPPLAVPAALAQLPLLPAQRSAPMLAVRRIAIAAALLLSTALAVGLWLERHGAEDRLVVIEDASLTAPDVWDSIADFSGLDREWLANLK